MRQVIVSVSGGKDSTAVALLAREEFDCEVRYVFADTGHEQQQTYDYLLYLDEYLGGIETVRADFREQIAKKRIYVAEHWPRKGVPQADVERALAALRPTGNPFLDLCLWKGRFPSRMAQFCTQELKRRPLDALLLDALASGDVVESWRGLRRDESQNRKGAPARELAAEGWWVVQPIVEWSADKVVRYVRSWDVKLNPLYSQGMGRVGCFPCINVGKDELLSIAQRFPEEVARVREWEHLVSLASKRGATTFFTDSADEDETTESLVARLNIDARVEWAKTSRGGKQYNMLRMEPTGGCSSIYGLCE